MIKNEKVKGSKEEELQAYLFVHFTHESSDNSEQIYFAVSKDGMKWEALNNSKPILVSKLGEKGLRDPHIIRSVEGDKFYLIATDLSIYTNSDWTRSKTSGSKYIMTWESSDLVNWSEQRMIKVARDDAGCTWAPESIYDKATGEYMVFWASTVSSDNYGKQRIYYSKTRDFIHFTEAQIYIEKDGSVIDTTIIENAGKYYRFSKDGYRDSITMEVGDTLLGNFIMINEFTLLDVIGYEGPTCYKLNGEDKWCLLLDAYASKQGYQPFITSDLSTGKFEAITSEFTSPYLFRHGSVIPITLREYNNLKEAYGKEA